MGKVVISKEATSEVLEYSFIMESDTPPIKEKGTPKRVRLSTSLESKFGPPVRQNNER